MKTQAVNWRTPIALGVLTASGLFSALVSDGIGDAWSWIGLAAPLAVAVFCVCRRRSAQPVFMLHNRPADGEM